MMIENIYFINVEKLNSFSVPNIVNYFWQEYIYITSNFLHNGNSGVIGVIPCNKGFFDDCMDSW